MGLSHSCLLLLLLLLHGVWRGETDFLTRVRVFFVFKAPFHHVFDFSLEYHHTPYTLYADICI